MCGGVVIFACSDLGMRVQAGFCLDKVSNAPWLCSMSSLAVGPPARGEGTTHAAFCSYMPASEGLLQCGSVTPPVAMPVRVQGGSERGFLGYRRGSIVSRVGWERRVFLESLAIPGIDGRG